MTATVVDQTVIVRGTGVLVIVPAGDDTLPQLLESLEESVALWDTTEDALICRACQRAAAARCDRHAADQAKSDGFRALLKSLSGVPGD